MTSTDMKRAAGLTAIVLAAFIPVKASAQFDDYTSPRNAVVNAAGARMIRIEAGAGFLHITGRPRMSQVDVKGVARASNKRLLDEIKLLAERQGDVVVIKMIMPDQHNSFWGLFGGNYSHGLDLTIDVPSNIPLTVSDGSGEAIIKGTGPVTLNDGSGEIELAGITGAVRIIDGSGGITISGVEGDVYVDDGSGSIDANNVTGNFTVGDDGSGEINLSGVGGTVHVREKGSGSLRVTRVGGDFIVDSKGSGGIEYDTVKGTVNVPERRHRRG